MPGLRSRPSIFRRMATVLVFLLLLQAVSGCRKKAPVPTPVPEEPAAEHPMEAAPAAVTSVASPAESEEAEPVPSPAAHPSPSSFELGEESFRAGNYVKAVKLYDKYLAENPEAPNRDLALFHLGLSCVLPSGAGKNAPRAAETFRRLIRLFPKSPYRDPAEYILGLQLQVESLKLDIKEKEAKIKQLGDELQKLKEIDMQRRPSRPPS
jgi:tetratricopeptide (TPR) repeat protein